MDMVKVSCYACGEEFEVPAEIAGQVREEGNEDVIVCPKCAQSDDLYEVEPTGGYVLMKLTDVDEALGRETDKEEGEEPGEGETA